MPYEDVEFKLIAPDIDQLLGFFDRGWGNAKPSTDGILRAVESLVDIMRPVAPMQKNDEVKSIWLRIPRGTIEDFGDFDELKEDGEFETYEEFERYWSENYPDEYNWYEFVLAQCFNPDGNLRFYAVGLGNNSIVSASTEDKCFESYRYGEEETAIKLCTLIAPAVEEAVEMLKSGEYNDFVEKNLPYQFRTGVILRSDLWAVDSDYKKFDYDGLPDAIVTEFIERIKKGLNEAEKIGRIKDFTANDFFRACKIGYEAIGKDCKGISLPDLYMRYSDGRDEGLTGKGHGLNEGPGIDFDSPEAWKNWYFDRNRCGGHPWEVVPGGNSTHMSLCVRNDKRDGGFYFHVSGLHRQFESVKFYIALADAGLPVLLDDAEELVARFSGTDYQGIVPHHVFPRYCSSMFPDEYGTVIDFMHVFDEDIEKYGEKIIWLPEEPTMLLE